MSVAAANSPGRMVQPRVLHAPGGQIRPGGSTDKPSVIVVHKGPGGKAILTKVCRQLNNSSSDRSSKEHFSKRRH